MCSQKRGQINIMAVLAVAIIVLFVGFFLFSSEKTEQRIDHILDDSEKDVEKAKQLQEIIENVVKQSMYDAVSEMGETGGFAADDVVEPTHLGQPVYIIAGKKVNFPKEDAVKHMLREEIRRRLEDNLFDLARKKKYGITQLKIDGSHLVIKKEDITIGDNYIHFQTMIPMEITRDGNRLSVKGPFSVNLNIRLLRLYKMAKAFVELYTSKPDNHWNRQMERLISELMRGDPTLPQASKEVGVHDPFTLQPNLNPEETAKVQGFCTLCDKKVSYSFGQIKEQVAKDVLVASSIFSTRAQNTKYQKELLKYLVDNNVIDNLNSEREEDVKSFAKGFYWEFETKLGSDIDNFPALELTLNGNKNDFVIESDGKEETLNPFQCECLKRYKAEYEMDFPMEVIITDLLPTGKLLGGATILKPLQFKFVIFPKLAKDGITATLPVESNYDEEYDFSCSGSCKLDLNIFGPEVAQVIIEPCGDVLSKKYDFNDNTNIFPWTNVPCGLRDITIVPENLEEYAKITKRMLIESTGKKTDFIVPKYANIKGKVYLNTSSFCSDRKEPRCYSFTEKKLINKKFCVEDDKKHLKTLSYVDGNPPNYIHIQLIPLQPRRERYEVIVDDKGSYHLQNVLPGKYLLLVAPSVDVAGNAGYKVKTHAKILEVTMSEERDIVMNSIYLAKHQDTFIPVYRIVGCGV